MITLLEAVYPFIADETFSGIRISTRPDCIDNQVLEVLKKYGVTSIELGAQSMRDTVLELNDRGHTASQVEQASRLIKQKGFELGLQMMTHLYGDNDDGAIYTANRFVEIKPDTVRIYPTVILKGTKLAQLYNSGEYTVPDINKAVQLIVKLIDIFNNAGIKIIKLGLHASDDVEKEMVGGLYHPAFRELCESEMFFLKAMDIILNENIFGKVIIKVNPKDLSKMIGQKRKNIDKFKQKGYVVKIVADNSVLYNDIKVEKEG